MFRDSLLLQVTLVMDKLGWISGTIMHLINTNMKPKYPWSTKTTLCGVHTDTQSGCDPDYMIGHNSDLRYCKKCLKKCLKKL
ncbi:MAG: hypothetical protein WC479_00765 [Candidatus Izemoplasmatales bacterium]